MAGLFFLIKSAVIGSAMMLPKNPSKPAAASAPNKQQEPQMISGIAKNPIVRIAPIISVLNPPILMIVIKKPI